MGGVASAGGGEGADGPLASSHPRAPSKPSPVLLHIYNVGETREVWCCNKALRVLGTGIFHSGVEVNDREWSFEGRGIFSCQPRRCEGHSYFETLPLGDTSLTQAQVFQIILMLEKDWKGKSYDLLRKNCCHFCQDLCRWLGVRAVPRWVTSLAGAGAMVVDTRDDVEACCAQSSVVCFDPDENRQSSIMCSPCHASTPQQAKTIVMQVPEDRRLRRFGDVDAPRVATPVAAIVDSSWDDSVGAENCAIHHICPECLNARGAASPGCSPKAANANSILVIDGKTDWTGGDTAHADSRRFDLDPLERGRRGGRFFRPRGAALSTAPVPDGADRRGAGGAGGARVDGQHRGRSLVVDS